MLVLGYGNTMPLTLAATSHCYLIWDILVEGEYPAVIHLPLVKYREMVRISFWADFYSERSAAEKLETPILEKEANFLNMPVDELLMLMEAAIHVKAKPLTDLIIAFGRSIIMGTTPATWFRLKIACNLPPEMREKLIREGVTMEGMKQIIKEMEDYEMCESESDSDSDSDSNTV
ncbi:uncharacterized protein DMAD_01230 [Drosophila madeirensis]